MDGLKNVEPDETPDYEPKVSEGPRNDVPPENDEINDDEETDPDADAGNGVKPEDE